MLRTVKCNVLQIAVKYFYPSCSVYLYVYKTVVTK